MMTDIITSGAIHSLKSFFMKKKEKNTIIDPFSCLVKLSMLKYLDKGTKISVHQNRICFNSPTIIQGMVRFIYGDGREDLHNIFQPIQKCVEWFWNDKNDDITYMFNNAVNGLKILKNAYSTYATIQHTIDYYIIVLMQKNNDLISRLGINILDINKITDVVCNKKNDDDISLSTDHQTKATIVPTTSGNKSKKDKNANKSHPEENPISVQALSSEKSQLPVEDDTVTNPQKDIHKFLFELWNEREMKIVINLFKELEAKQYSSEKDYIFTNLMQYCEMKENKLYKYIEENSSVL